MPVIQLQNHTAEYVKDYQACAALSERIGQLSAAHPLLFHALVTGFGPLEARCEAIGRAERGDKLRDICSAMSMPYAFRVLPASILLEPLQHAVISEDGARLAALRINRLAHEADKARAVQAVFFGTGICDEDFGLWLAHPRNLPCVPLDFKYVRSLAFYAWQSLQDCGLPAVLNRLAFSPHRGWTATVRTAAQWYQYFKFQAYFGEDPIGDMWAEPYQCGNYEIIPLRTAKELLDEVLLMDNCLKTYADDLDCHACRLFSVRRSGQKLGTVEIRPRRCGALRVVQFRGPMNMAMNVQPWDAVHDWIARQKPLWPRSMSYGGHSHRRDHFQTLVQAHQRTHALPDQFWTGIDSLKRLEMELALLKGNPFSQRRTRA